MILNVADLMRSSEGPLAHTLSTMPMEKDVVSVTARRVLVVDDSITTRTLERNILFNAGFQVLVASDGEEAFAMAQSETLHAVVSDVDMPKMAGFELTRRIKGDERLKSVPVVLVTSLHNQEDRIRGLDAGADAYITKGTFDQDELLATIERLVS